MTWPPLETMLPAPRDDEPRSLREDLLDEVRDHLQSAYQGELLRTPDPVEAEKNVLARFGDPARVVRQLWFQAMREKIMSQRILVVTCLVMAVASIAGMGLMWNLNAQNQRAMMKSQRELLELVEGNQKANLQTMQAFIAEQKSATTKTDPEWCPVKIRCSLGKKGGPPAKGFTVSFMRLASENSGFSSTLTVPEDGVVDMGLLQFGKFRLVIQSVNPEGVFATTEELVILPRLPQVPIYGEIVCPDGLPADVRVKPRVVWPEQLRDKKLWLLCTFSSDWDVKGRKWWIESLPNNQNPWKSSNPQFGAGGFGNLSFDSQGIGYCSLEDNLEQHVNRSTYKHSAGHSWQCLINEQGEVWDLGLIRMGTFHRPLASGNDTFDFYFPEFGKLLGFNPAGGFGGGSPATHMILQQYSELTPGAEDVVWPAGELRLTSMEVVSSPHREYGRTQDLFDEGREQNVKMQTSIVAQDILGSFRVQRFANLEGLPTDHPLTMFRGVSGKENDLEIDIPESWQAEILDKFNEVEKFKKVIRKAKERHEVESEIPVIVDDGPIKNEQAETQKPVESSGDEEQK